MLPKTKVCIKCRKRKSKTEFNIDKSRKDGLYPWCKKCRSEYYKMHKEKFKKRTKKWLLDNMHRQWLQTL